MCFTNYIQQINFTFYFIRVVLENFVIPNAFTWVHKNVVLILRTYLEDIPANVYHNIL
jgi:hypothetical protein